MKTFIILSLLILNSWNIIKAQVTEDWVARFTSDSIRNESISDMFIDSQGNVYFTGNQKELAYPRQAEVEALTVKYNSSGVQQWIQNFHAPENNGASGRAIHVDAVGNTYIAGICAIYSGGLQTLVVKYAPDGTQLWSYRFNYVGNTATFATDIITDLSGNVYVTGYYYPNVIVYNNVFLIKLGSSGNLINQTFYNFGSEGGVKIGLDGAGKIIVGGYCNTDSTQMLVVKYEQNLDFVWAVRAGRDISEVKDMTIDNNSNIILTGKSGTDFYTIKVDPLGSVLWRKSYNSVTGFDNVKSVKHDHLGNIYVTGECGTAGLPLTYALTTIKYAPDGTELWVKSYNEGNIGITCSAIAVDNSANVYIAGNSYVGQNFVTIKYDTDGNFKWRKDYNGTADLTDIPACIGVDIDGNILTGGSSYGTGSGIDVAIVKYKPSTISIQNTSSEIPDGYSLSQNYPNPFNPTTKIRFDILSQENSPVKLIVYDASGKEVQTLVDEKLNAGSYEVSFKGNSISSGTYFYRLTAGEFVQIKKMILVK